MNKQWNIYMYNYILQVYNISVTKSQLSLFTCVKWQKTLNSDYCCWEVQCEPGWTHMLLQLKSAQTCLSNLFILIVLCSDLRFVWIATIKRKNIFKKSTYPDLDLSPLKQDVDFRKLWKRWAPNAHLLLSLMFMPKLPLRRLAGV